MRKSKNYTLDQLKSLALWHAKRTDSITTDEKSVYRAWVSCWGYSAGPVCGDELDMELEIVINSVLSKVSYENLEKLAIEIDGEYGLRDAEDEDDRDFQYIVYCKLYYHVQSVSEREYTDKNA